MPHQVHKYRPLLPQLSPLTLPSQAASVSLLLQTSPVRAQPQEAWKHLAQVSVPPASALSLGWKMGEGLTSSVDEKCPGLPQSPTNTHFKKKKNLLTNSLPYNCICRLNMYMCIFTMFTYIDTIHQNQLRSNVKQVLHRWPGIYL